MIWSDICWNLSCCKLETKRFLVNVDQSESKQNKLRERILIQSCVFFNLRTICCSNVCTCYKKERKTKQDNNNTYLVI